MSGATDSDRMRTLQRRWRCFTAARIVDVGLLLGALGHGPYEYYAAVQAVTCATAVWGAYWAFRRGREKWGWVFAALPLLFNPFDPARLGRALWVIVDLLTAGVMLASVIAWRPRPGQRPASACSSRPT